MYSLNRHSLLVVRLLVKIIDKLFNKLGLWLTGQHKTKYRSTNRTIKG